MKQRFTSLLIAISFLTGMSYGQSEKRIEKINSSITIKQQKTAELKMKMTRANAQNIQFSDNYCVSHKITNKYLKENGLEAESKAFQEQMREIAANWNSDMKMVSGPIPIIFHVVYNNTAENVSNTIIQDLFNTLNQDFQLLNSDASTSHTTSYGFTASNADMSFCLAQQDPSGTPLVEPGVERVSTSKTYWDPDLETDDMKSTSLGGADPWDHTKYVNVWICDITNGAMSGTAGYAYLANTSYIPPASIDGIVLDYNLGTYSGSRALTHEMGHYLGLNHTWEGTGSGTCGDDDGYTDTPYTAGPSFNFSGSCTGNQSTCGTIQTQYENFMDYSDCASMFTTQQTNYMNVILSGVRSSLLSSTACNAAGPPVCNINTSSTTTTQGGSINFTDGSTGGATAWSWNFDNTSNGGATPSTSTTQNPGNVTFGNIATYDVQLTVSNSFGSNSCSASINVIASTGCDSLQNLADTNSLTIYGSGSGFMAGTNNYGDLAKVEYYSNYGAYTHVTAADIYLFGLQDGGNGSTFDLTIWDDNAGLPGNIIGQAQYDLAAVSAATAGAQGGILRLPFNSPVLVNGNPFYIGVDFSNLGAGDTIGIVHKLPDVTTPSNTSFEMWSDGTWHDMGTSWWGDWTMYINPFITDLPVSGSLTASPASVCEGGSIDFSATGSNITGYDWYFNGSPTTSTNASETVTYSAAGSYTEVAYLYGACYGQDIQGTTVTITTGPTATATTTDPSCVGNDGQIVVSATGATSFSIDGGSTFQPSGTFTGLADGTYNVVAKDANGCEGTTTATLNAGAGSLVVNAATTDPGCAGNDGQINITATGGTTYQYSIDGGSSFQSSGLFTGLSVNTYSIVVSDIGGCQGTTSTTLNPGGITLSVSSTTNSPSCGNNDGSIVTTVSNGTAPYQFSNDNGLTFNSGSSPYTFSTLGAAIYEVVVTDANGCQGSEQVTLSNPSAPTVTATPTNASCNGASDGSVLVTWTSGSSPFSIDVNGTSTSAVTSPYTENGLGAGIVNVIITDVNGCTGNASATIGEPIVVTHSTTISNSSCGMNNGSISVSGNGGSGTYTYSIDNGSSFQSSGSFTALSANTYQVIAKDANGCTSIVSTETVTGTGNVTASVSSTTDETCASSNGSIVLSQTGGSSPYTYSIDGGSSFQSSSTFSSLAAGTYSIVVKDAGGCEGTSSTTLTNTGGVSPTISPDQTICFGTTAVFNAGGAGIGGTYSWDNGLGSGSSQSVTPATTTTYTVTITDVNSCQATASTTVTVETAPTVTMTPSNPTICSGQSVTLTASGAQTYTWNTGASTASITVSPTNQTPYSVIGQNGSCIGSSVTSTVSVETSPTIVAGSDQTNIAVGGTVNFSNVGSGATSYSWNFGDGGSSTLGSPSHTFGTQGVYTVILSGTLGNCTSSDTLTINVGVTGVDETSLEDAITLFPNPNNGLFKMNIQLNNDSDIDVRLFNTIGEQIDLINLRNISNTTIDFDLSEKAEGFYFVNVTTKNGSITRRISVIK